MPLVVIGLIAAAVVGKMIWIGTVDSQTFVELGREKREHTNILRELRGSILDRNGETLAMSVPTKLVAADPTAIDNVDAVATKLATLLGVPREKIVGALERPDTQYSIVARQVNPETGDKISAAHLRGIMLEDDPQRVRVNGDLGRSVIGSMDKWGTKANSGIEREYDDVLRPVDGVQKIERGVGGSTIPGSERIEEVARPGADVSLTIDRSMQYIVDEALKKQVEAVGAKGGTVVIGRPQTGEIFAMSSCSRTDGDPNGAVIQGSLNQAVRLYEPGSVMKIVTIAAGLDLGLVTPKTTFMVPSSITIDKKTVNDAESHPTMAMTVEDILAHSSNVGTIKIAQRIEAAAGLKTINQMLRSFGFGTRTALGLPFEQDGIVKKRWYGTDVMSIPIGQSITVSPVQMWAAYNVIANSGMYVPPKIVREIVDASGRYLPVNTTAGHSVVSKSTASMVTSLLEKVIEEGTGKEWKIPGFNVAAKTGTAYKVLKTGGYGKTDAERLYAASFVGFFPATDPQISIMVMIDEPEHGQHLGAVAAGPLFNLLAKESMRRFSIAGDAMSSTRNTAPVRALPAYKPAPPTTAAPEIANDGDVAPAPETASRKASKSG